ncbi:hypothetical protein TNCV_1900901 [Trichonephila clavipes]|nr:hypothetical protein TNCV_1900901 [Trichonephila clavipes]
MRGDEGHVVEPPLELKKVNLFGEMDRDWTERRAEKRNGKKKNMLFACWLDRDGVVSLDKDLFRSITHDLSEQNLRSYAKCKKSVDAWGASIEQL